MRLRTTYRQPGAAGYRRPGGAWDVPTLDRLLSSARPAGTPAVVDGRVSLDSGTLERLVASVAGGLRAAGVRRGDLVTWQLPNWWEALVLFRACWRCGAVAAPLHHQVGAAEVTRLLAELRPAVALSTAGLPLADLIDAIEVRGADRRFDALLDGPSGPRRHHGHRVGHGGGAVHLRLDRASQGRTPLPPWAGLQGPLDDPGTRPGCRGRGPDALTARPRVGPVERGAGSRNCGHGGGPHGEVGRRTRGATWSPSTGSAS